MVTHKRVEGVVEYNNGQFAEIQTVGTEDIEKDLLLSTIQIHREDTADTAEEFRQRFPVGTWLETRIRASRPHAAQFQAHTRPELSQARRVRVPSAKGAWAQHA